jgi:hypothetical protein
VANEEIYLDIYRNTNFIRLKVQINNKYKYNTLALLISQSNNIYIYMRNQFYKVLEKQFYNEKDNKLGGKINKGENAFKLLCK